MECVISKMQTPVFHLHSQRQARTRGLRSLRSRYVERQQGSQQQGSQQQGSQQQYTYQPPQEFQRPEDFLRSAHQLRLTFTTEAGYVLNHGWNMLFMLFDRFFSMKDSGDIGRDTVLKPGTLAFLQTLNHDTNVMFVGAPIQYFDLSSFGPPLSDFETSRQRRGLNVVDVILYYIRRNVFDGTSMVDFEYLIDFLLRSPYTSSIYVVCMLNNSSKNNYSDAALERIRTYLTQLGNDVEQINPNIYNLAAFSHPLLKILQESGVPVTFHNPCLDNIHKRTRNMVSVIMRGGYDDIVPLFDAIKVIYDARRRANQDDNGSSEDDSDEDDTDRVDESDEDDSDEDDSH